MSIMRNIVHSYIFINITVVNVYAAENILSIDNTLIIQVLIFVAAIFMLNNFLFKPLFELQSKREKLTTGTSSEAKDLKLKTEETIKRYNDQINVARVQVQDERNEIRSNAQQSASEMTTRARNEVNSILDDARADIEKESKAMREKIRPEIELLARDVASRLLNKEI